MAKAQRKNPKTKTITKDAPSSIRWDSDVKSWLEEEAKKQNLPMSVIANQTIREAKIKKGQLEERVERIERFLGPSVKNKV